MDKIIIALLIIVAFAGFMILLSLWSTPTSTLNSKIKQIEDFAQNEQALVGWGWGIKLEAICCQDYGWLGTLTIYQNTYDDVMEEIITGEPTEYEGWGQTIEEAVDDLIEEIK